MAICVICGREGDGRFCAGCGAPKSVVCDTCGATLPLDARFCSTCGSQVVPDRGPTLALGFPDLHLGLDERHRILSDVQGEHRLVTVVFADMTSSVARTAELEPEDAVHLVGRLLTTMVDVLVRYGGRIDRFLGDGLLAVFGIPDAHEDDPIRAVRASLEINDRAEELGIGVTVGINTGAVYFGPVGSDLHEELTVMGPVVNLAARLQGKATGGEVLIGEATYAQAHGAFDLSEVRLDIKGFAEPVTAYVAERILDRPDKVRGVEGLHTELIGRDSELDRLRTAVSRPGSAISVVGDAGVGKSRLVSELRRRFEADGGVWLEGRCAELTSGVAYGPIRDLLEHRVTDLDGLRRSVDESIASGRLPTDWNADLGPYLFSLLGPPDQAVAATDGDKRAQLTATAVVEYLKAMAGDATAVLFIDDLHWADGRTVDLLAGSWPDTLGRIIAARPEQGSPAEQLLERAHHMDSIRLSPLSETDSRRLIQQLLHIDGLPESVESLILRAAEGNPFYVEELIRSFIQRGLVVEDRGVWTATAEIDRVDVPTGVQAVVMGRVDRLDRRIRHCAQVASVLGRIFHRDILQSMVDTDVDSALSMLSVAGFIEQERAGEYSFVHALTHQAILDTLLPSRRAELHEKAGAIYEQVSPGALDQLAYHFGQGRDHAKAVRYLTLAAADAADAYLTDTSTAYLTEAIARVDDLPPEDHPAALAQLFAIRGELAERSLRHTDARTDLHSALELVELPPLEAARLHRLIGLTYRQEDRFDDAHAAFDAAEQALTRAPDPTSEPARRAWIDIQRERSFALYFGGRGRELPAHNGLVGPVIDEHGTPTQQIDHLVSQALAAFTAERFSLTEPTIGYTSRAVLIADAAGNLAQRAESRFVNGFALLWGDRIVDAEPVLARSVTESTRIGDRMLQDRARSYHAICLRRLGRAEEADDAAVAARELALDVDNSYYAGHAEAVLAWVALRRGDIDAARRHGEAAYQSWGPLVRGGDEGLNVEFSFLAAWPMLEVALEAHEDTRRHLEYLRVPWERPMPAELVTEIHLALAEPNRVSEQHARSALELARLHHLA